MQVSACPVVGRDEDETGLMPAILSSGQARALAPPVFGMSHGLATPNRRARFGNRLRHRPCADHLLLAVRTMTSRRVFIGVSATLRRSGDRGLEATRRHDRGTGRNGVERQRDELQLGSERQRKGASRCTVELLTAAQGGTVSNTYSRTPIVAVDRHRHAVSSTLMAAA